MSGESVGDRPEGIVTISPCALGETPSSGLSPLLCCFDEYGLSTGAAAGGASIIQCIFF
ncbi:MAG: hypothetical protein ABSG90_14190 [Dehalococcoidia bacterium]